MARWDISVRKVYAYTPCGETNSGIIPMVKALHAPGAFKRVLISCERLFQIASLVEIPVDSCKTYFVFPGATASSVGDSLRRSFLFRAFAERYRADAYVTK
eukprot:8259029-Pyramimonas_sp.AAC.1